MNPLLVLNEAFCIRLAATLLHFLWQGAALGGLAWMAGMALRGSAARLRYRVFILALVLMAASPLATFWWLGDKAPAFVHSAIPNSQSAKEPNLNPQFEEHVGPRAVPASNPQSANQANIRAEARTPNNYQTAIENSAINRIARAIVALYLAGVLVMFGRLLIGLRGGQRLRRRSQPVEDPAILEALARAARAVGLKAAPAVIWCAQVAVPTVVGLFKPAILLPTALVSGVAPEQIELLLLHELAHLRRRDHWFNLAQWIIETVLFFHPAIWWISRSIAAERELCCDDMVLAAGGEAADYADSLLRVAEMARRLAAPSATLALGAAGRHSRLGARILRLVDEPARERFALARVWPLFGLLLAIFAASLSIAYRANGKDVKDSKDAKDANAKWAAVFSCGLKAEIVGVAEHPRNEKGIWAPDGTPLTTPPMGFEKTDGGFSSSGQIVRELCIRLTNLPDGGIDVTTGQGGSSSLACKDG